ncbi:MAG: hybrid sensor histidine kinase/response regulator [Myxococcota bacterium]
MVSEATAGAAPAYVVLFMLFVLAGGYATRHPAWSAGFGATLLIAALGRLGLQLRRTAIRNPARWCRWFGPLVLLSAAAWTGFCCFALLVDGLTWPPLMLLVVSAGFSAVASGSLAPYLPLVRVYHLVTLLPPALVALAALGGRGGFALAGILMVQLAFQLWDSTRRHHAHWQSMENTELLRVREQTNALLATALEHAAESFEITDADGFRQYVNPAFERTLGESSAPTTASNTRHVLPPDLLGALAEGRPWSGDLTVHTGDGRVLHQEVSVSPVTNDEGRVIHHVWIRRDVTQTRQLQARLMLADRMASMGTLAAGVAHEVNNPLASLLLELDDVARGLAQLPGSEAAAEMRSRLTGAREAAERVRDIVGQLRVLSRYDVSEVSSVQLHEALEAAVRMASNEIRHRATLELDFGPELPAVVGEEGRLVQVFVNLLVNAAQALDGSPAPNHRIVVRARSVEGGRVQVEVRDTGPGFAADALPRIFDPFFTTKPVGEGTGLGLAICHSIVSSFGGDIRAFNAPEGGGVVQIHLPMGRPPAVSVPRSSSHRAPSGSPHRPLRVLVVDDELQVGRAVGRALRGYQVTVVADGREAVARWHRGDFDVMLCDVMMPSFTGMDVYRALAEGGRGEEARIVFMTGGAFTAPMRAFLERVGNPVVEKPFEPRQVRELLRQVVEAAEARGTG